MTNAVAYYQTRLHQFSECLTNFTPLIGTLAKNRQMNHQSCNASSDSLSALATVRLIALPPGGAPQQQGPFLDKKVNQLSSLSLHFDDRLPLRRKLDRQGGPPRPHPTLIRVICLWMSAASRHIQWTTPHSNEHVETLFIFFENSFSHFETKWTLNDSSAPRGTSSKLIIAGLFLSQFYFYLYHSIALLMLYKLSFESNLIRWIIRPLIFNQIGRKESLIVATVCLLILTCLISTEFHLILYHSIAL